MALQLARHAADQQEVPVGALVIYEDEIIAKGWNQTISRNDPTAHAEIMALREAASVLKNYRLINTSLYVTLEPCAMCVGAVLHARVKQVIFGAHDAKTGAAGSVFNLLTDTRHNHSVEVAGGVLEKECANVLHTFFCQRR